MTSRHQWSLTVLRAGSFRLDGGGMFGIIPKVLWSRWVEPDAANRIGLQTNCLLLRDGSRNVLVETGCGDKWSDRDRAQFAMERRTVLDALAEVGVSPDRIDAVIVTHLHFDHAAGLTRMDDGNPVATFPNAEVLVQRQEWLDAVANRSTMSKTYFPSTVEPIADHVRLLDGDGEALPGIRVELLPGHTWGMQGVRFRDDHGEIAFPGDLIPTRLHAHPSVTLAYDVLPHESMVRRRTFLAKAEAEGTRLVLDHEPGAPTVRVARDPEDPSRYALVPVENSGTGGPG
jgi:glyoxylase-like metal-dependent hydrolase (beta-lactamase superfamily II)